jgi:N-acetylglucosaminyldiphosphoundecaprenol N-acetyl-beta-D-mannosaminyltransferase
LAGAVQTPPRWRGRAGLEWLFRLITDPRRFAHRYLIEPWTVLARVASHSIGRRR